MRGSKPTVTAALFGIASLVAVSLAVAGAEKVAFPAYQTHVLYDVLDQPDNKEVRELYINPEALRNFRTASRVICHGRSIRSEAEGPVGSGAGILAPHFMQKIPLP